jgi:aspartyl-tRNA(Asn)/glutamyl-tRNA(Gln) amidotransferase subunit A
MTLSVEESVAAAHSLQPVLHAFSELFAPVRVAASAAGPLAGLALAVKDSFDVAGRASYCGNASAVAPMAVRHATALTRLLAGGMSLIGKTHMPQLAFGGWGTNAVTGAPRNPWDAQQFRVAGGSSSGSAVAVAAGIVHVALGSDTGGSVRIPASLCGVVGFKPGRLSVSREGLYPLAPSLDTVGVLASDVPRAISCWQLLRDDRVEPPARPSLRRLALARLRPSYGCSPATSKALATVSRCMQQRGFVLVEVDLPWEPQEVIARSGCILGYEAAQLHGHFLRERAHEMDPAVAQRLEAGQRISRAAYESALLLRSQDQREHHDWLDQFDALLLPTTPIAARTLQSVDEQSMILSTFTRAGNYFDLPALSLPCGFDEAGLPLGLQVYTQAGREDACLALALDVEDALAASATRARPPISAC